MRDLAWDDSRTQGLEAERVTVIEELRDPWGRMEIRFSRDSDVRQRFNTWSEALDDYSQALRFGHAGKRPYVPEMVKVVELQDSARKAADRWLEAARAAVAELE